MGSKSQTVLLALRNSGLWDGRGCGRGWGGICLICRL